MLEQTPPDVQQPLYAELLKPASWAALVTAIGGALAVVLNWLRGRRKDETDAEADEREQNAANNQKLIDNLQASLATKDLRIAQLEAALARVIGVRPEFVRDPEGASKVWPRNPPGPESD